MDLDDSYDNTSFAFVSFRFSTLILNLLNSMLDLAMWVKMSRITKEGLLD